MKQTSTGLVKQALKELETEEDVSKFSFKAWYEHIFPLCIHFFHSQFVVRIFPLLVL
jgi:hypothetical protein